MPSYNDQEMDFDEEDDYQAYGARSWLNLPCLRSPDALKKTLLVGAAFVAFIIIILLGKMLFTPSQLPSFEVLRSPSDQRLSKYIILKNDLRVFLVSDPKCDKAGAAMDVAAGALDDPEDHEGLAHFLEHMLFLGSAKYPQEGEFNKFMQLHAGSSNAYTDQWHTNYHFTIQKDSLEGALDRLAQFFIAPLLSASGASREMNAVNSEHKKNLQNDDWAMWQMYKHLASPLHPFHKFSTGSLETLDQEDTVERLVEFYEQFYTSASTMRLTILGKEDLKTLETWAAKYFSYVPQQKPFVRVPAEFPVWPQTGIQVNVNPIADLRQVILLWEVPILQALYRTMIAGYLSHVVGSRSEGSLYQVLKAKDWVEDISLDLQHVRDFTIVEVKVGLTATGIQHTDELAATFFQYLHLVERDGVNCQVWDDKLAMEKLEFRFQEAVETSDFVSKTAAAMQIMAPADLLGSPQNYYCDVAVLHSVISELTPQKMLLFVVSSTHSNLTKVEPVYGTQYSVHVIPAATLSQWSTMPPAEEMMLPPANPFLPVTFDLFHAPDPAVTIKPLHQTPGLTVWFQPSQLFSQPKLVYGCEVHYPSLRAQLLQLLKLRLYAEVMIDALEAPLYEAGEVGVEGSIKAVGGSLIFSVNGHSVPSGQLWRVLLMAAQQGFTAQRFNAIKEKMKLDTANLKFSNAYLYAWRVLKPLLLERPAYTVAQQLEALDHVTFDDLKDFAKRLAQLPNHIECLGFGNIQETDATGMASTLVTALQSKVSTEFRTKDIGLLQEGTDTAIIANCPNPSDLNSVLLSTFQLPADHSPHTALQFEVIQFILDQEAYYQLRTQEQLGYVVFTVAYTLHAPGYNYSYYHFLIQSATQPPDYLDDRVEAFLENALGLLKTITPADFEGFKQALWQQKWTIPLNLMDEYGQLWSEILTHTYQFDRKELEYTALQDITLRDLVRTFQSSILDKDTRRKVSLLMYGKDLDVIPAEGGAKPAETVNITDVEGWKEKLTWISS